MAKRTKITKAELKKLQDAMAEFEQSNKTVSQLAVMIQDAKEAMANAIAKLKSSQKNYQEVFSALDKRYGNVNVNITDGTITEGDDNTGDS
jgi:FtsZ-binding cell division protein ZapB|tara:strand:+ start:1255 stop:1527 length:273 start_codon:yes stop_codon:yes gene_type:complete